MKYFISDSHFGHFNIIKYANRPFLCYEKDNFIYTPDNKVVAKIEFQDGAYTSGNKTSEDLEILIEQEIKYHSIILMNETMINAWNTKVKPDDTVYFGGDFSYMTVERMKSTLSKLNGYKILIKGNHDKSKQKMLEYGFDEAYNTLELEIGGFEVVMSHYPYVPSELTEIAKKRPNMTKKVSKGKTYKESDLISDWNYENIVNFILKAQDGINPEGLGEKAFKQFQRASKRLIGTRLINEGKILIHGHTHSYDKVRDNMINISAEAWNYLPASEDDIKALIDEINKKHQPPQK